ncbi:class I adenylate-forming enzyme family protein [Rhodococcus sp. NPDC058514]|uniref:class I adenylate-forming enzyme family protein n=1 Tax=unclassified Rhodococcus (in: high G+C Gram-positive bacteria) TaxID=192944 RepID=UPI00365B78CD
MSLHESLVEALHLFPTALIGTARAPRSFAELAVDAEEMSVVVEKAIRHPDARILIALKNRADYVPILLSILAGGHLPILADPALTQNEIGVLSAGCGIDYIVGDRTGENGTALGLHAQLWATGRDATAPRPPTDPATEICRLTSGSTRTPGCIEFSGTAVLNAARTWIGASGTGRRDRILCFAGLYNGLAFNTALLPALLTGAGLILPTGLPTAGNILRHIATVRPTIVTAFPAAYERLLAYALDDVPADTRDALANIRLRLSSAAPLSEEVSEHVRRLSGPIADYYGVAETGPITFHDKGGSGKSQGRLLPNVEVRSEPRGPGGGSVFCVHSTSMGTKYLNYPGEFERHLTPDGYYITSDTGAIVDGELYIRGRTTPILNIGGKKFSVESVEHALRGHTRVTDCWVTQIQAPSGRDCVGAVIETEDGIDPRELRRYLSGVIAPFKIPEVIVSVDRLPRGNTGKVRFAEAAAILTKEFDNQRSAVG